MIWQQGCTVYGMATMAQRFGWRLGRAYRGRDYAREAARAALRYTFDALHFPRVLAVTYSDNDASQRVLQKLGIRYQGSGHYYRGMRVPGT